MTTFTLSALADIDATSCQESDNIAGLRAFVDLAPCTPVRIRADFKVEVAVTGAKFDGISSPRFVSAGQPVTIFGIGARFKGTDVALDGSKLYGLNATPGVFDDAATIKCLRPVGLYGLQVILVGMV